MNFVYRDFKKIHEEYLKTGDASGGKLRWDLALIDRHYDDLRPELPTVHLGAYFISAVESTNRAFVEEDIHTLKSNLGLFQMISSQAKMRLQAAS